MSKRTKLDTVGLHWPSKRVEALGERKFRDIVDILPRPGHLRDKAQKSGTVPAVPGRLATMGDIHTECRSADLDNVEGLQGNDCRLKKWYREWQRTSDERRTVIRMVEELATFELSMSRLYVCP